MPRYKWPKTLPLLSEEQQRISDDFVRHWHEVLPKRFTVVEHFNHGYPVKSATVRSGCRTLEIGAGIGEHLRYENLAVQDYHCVELRENMARELRKRFPRVKTVVGDCQRRMPFSDGHFHRILAIHVLEHLPNLPAAVEEIDRVLSSDGELCVVIPCDPGFLYSVARKISAERIFKRRYGQPYGWFVRREHINSPHEILSVLQKRFHIAKKRFFPSILPFIDLNLCVGLVARKL